MRFIGVEYVFARIGRPEERQAAVLAISAFDGVHREHQRLLAETTTLARRLDAAPIALLPWPSATADQQFEGRLTTLAERIKLIEQVAPSARLVILSADAAQPWAPATLLERITAGWDVKALVIDLSADERLCGIELADAARQRGLSLATPSSTNNDAPLLSNEIRAAVIAGQVAEAAAALTYNYALSGEVIGGDRRGRLLGFPTANLRVDAGKMIPANGIYAVRVGLPGERDATRPAVASVGVRPTFGDDNTRLVEVHLLDFSMDLYGVRITTAFVEWLRPEERFTSVEALVRQMAQDVRQARERLAQQGQGNQQGQAHS
jgi:riboflavin kinase/FMN adenylyltransferase